MVQAYCFCMSGIFSVHLCTCTHNYTQIAWTGRYTLYSLRVTALAPLYKIVSPHEYGHIGSVYFSVITHTVLLLYKSKVYTHIRPDNYFIIIIVTLYYWNLDINVQISIGINILFSRMSEII